MYIDDDETIEETYKTIFFPNPALNAPPPALPLSPIHNRLALLSSTNQIENVSMLALLLSISIEIDPLDKNGTLPSLLPPPIPIDIDEVDNALLAFLPPPISFEIDEVDNVLSALPEAAPIEID